MAQLPGLVGFPLFSDQKKGASQKGDQKDPHGSFKPLNSDNGDSWLGRPGQTGAGLLYGQFSTPCSNLYSELGWRIC